MGKKPPGLAYGRSVRARQDQARDLVSWAAPHLGIVGGDGRNAADGRGQELGAFEHENGRGALWPPRAVLRPRRNPRARADIRVQAGQEDRGAALTSRVATL